MPMTLLAQDDRQARFRSTYSTQRGCPSERRAVIRHLCHIAIKRIPASAQIPGRDAVRLSTSMEQAETHFESAHKARSAGAGIIVVISPTEPEVVGLAFAPSITVYRGS